MLLPTKTLQGTFFGIGMEQVRTILRTDKDRYTVTFNDGQFFNLVIDDNFLAKKMEISSTLLQPVEPFIKEEDQLPEKEVDPMEDEEKIEDFGSLYD